MEHGSYKYVISIKIIQVQDHNLLSISLFMKFKEDLHNAVKKKRI